MLAGASPLAREQVEAVVAEKRAPIPMTGVGAHVVYLTLWMVGLPSNATTSMPLYVS